MESIEIRLTNLSEQVREEVAIAIKETFKELSLLADDLIEHAKKETSSKEEYDAFMRGAAFLFYKVCKSEDKQFKQTYERNTLDGAIQHCKDLLPFMSVAEQKDHIQLIEWLQELQEYRKKR